MESPSAESSAALRAALILRETGIGGAIEGKSWDRLAASGGQMGAGRLG